jgi:hypothetical protein
MCFGSPKIPNPKPIPPSPGPPVQSDIARESAPEARRKRIAALRYGLQSTIKTNLLTPGGGPGPNGAYHNSPGTYSILRKTLGGA